MRNRIHLNEVKTLDAEFVLNGKVVHVAQRYALEDWGDVPEDEAEDLKRLRRNAAAMNRRWQKKLTNAASTAKAK